MMQETLWIPYTQMKTAKEPFRAKAAKGSWIELDDGRRFLDGVSSWWVNLFGHGDPEMAEALANQSATLDQVAFVDFTHSAAEELSKLVLSELPSSLNKIFYSDNGSTAVEVALKLALQYWHNQGENLRRRFICFKGGYHGDTFGAMSTSAPSLFNRPFEPFLFNAFFVEFPERGGGVEEKEERVLNQIAQELSLRSKEYAAVLVEPIVQGVAGMRFCRPTFLQRLERLIKSFGLLLIYDEVMTGFGRTGEWFACRLSETQPDLICLAKGLTGGYLPLSITVASQKVFDAFYSDEREKAFYHGHSYMANPIACRAGVVTMQRLKRNPKIFQSFAQRYTPFLESLSSHALVANLRVQGTILAFDLVSQEVSGYSNPIGKQFQALAFEESLYLRPMGNVIYLMPAYTILDDELAFACNALNRVLNKM